MRGARGEASMSHPMARAWPRRPPRVRGAVRTACRAGAHHRSKAEARRCDELHLLQLGGKIRGLRAHPQVCFALHANGVNITTWRADFVYFDVEKGLEIVEDVKGYQTQLSAMKHRLMEAVHGVKVTLVHSGRR